MADSSTSVTISTFIKTLEVILPEDACLDFLDRWRTAEITSADKRYNQDGEFRQFKLALLSALGFESLCPESVLDSSCESIGGSTAAKRIKMSEAEPSDEDWEWLCDNYVDTNKFDLRFDHNNDDQKPANPPVVFTSSTSLYSHISTILMGLHAIYEDLKLKTHTWHLAGQLVDLLFMLAHHLGLDLYTEHYWRDFPSKVNFCSDHLPSKTTMPETILKPPFYTTQPSSVFQILHQILSNQISLTDPHQRILCISEVTHSTLKIVTLFSACFNMDPTCYMHYIGESTELSRLSSFEHSVSFDLSIRTETSSVYQETRSMTFTSEEGGLSRIALLARRLGMTPSEVNSYVPVISLFLWNNILACRFDPPLNADKEFYELIGRRDLTYSVVGDAHVRNNKNHDELFLIKGRDQEGFTCLDHTILRILFPKDQRVTHVCNMLQSSQPVLICLEQKPGVSDREFVEEQERHLYHLCLRTMALSTGRGMFTLASYRPLMSEFFPIPKLCMTGRAPPRNTVVDLSHIDMVPPNFTTWPLFHNGVAAGLRIMPKTSDSGADNIDSSWILYNRPKSISMNNDTAIEHAGFLFGLGLNGILARVSTMALYEYLQRGNELTKIACLLGLSAAKRESQDAALCRVLSIHVEALLPPTSTEFDVAPGVQISAVLGVGLLYQKSGNRHISEVLLAEIARPPGPEMEHYIDRESYALAAGFSYGLIHLCKGNEIGREDAPRIKMTIADQLCYFMNGGYRHDAFYPGDKYRTPSYQIREGDHINIHVTSPGATIALGLTFHRTENEDVASWLRAPDTEYLLASVRPDFLLLRTMAHGLIMWSTIQPTKEWVESYLPDIVSRFAFQKRLHRHDNIDYETLTQAYCNIVTGACMSLSLKYAGTGDEQAYSVVWRYMKLVINTLKDPEQADIPGRSTMESMGNVIIVSLATIMAGSGDVRILRICRFLRSRINHSYGPYGSHMAVGMALGLVFLGGCRYTLRNTPEAVAAMLIAFFPKYPIHSYDNRYHLQALRHMYVLAAEPRLLIPRSVANGQICELSLNLKHGPDSLYPNQLMTIRAPCLLPQLDFLEVLEFQDKRFWPIRFTRTDNWDRLVSHLAGDGNLWVKQKVGCLTYAEDPFGFKSYHGQNLIKSSAKGYLTELSELFSFTSDETSRALCKYLVVQPSDGHEAGLSEEDSRFQHYIYSVVSQCISQETSELLTALLNLYHACLISKDDSQVDQDDFRSLHAHQMCLLNEILLRNAEITDVPNSCLNPELLLTVRTWFEESVSVKTPSDRTLVLDYLTGRLDRSKPTNQAGDHSSLAAALVYHQLPPFGILSSGEQPDVMSTKSLPQIFTTLSRKLGRDVKPEKLTLMVRLLIDTDKSF